MGSHNAGWRYDDVRGVLRDLDAGDDRVAVGGDEHALVGDAQRSVTRVGTIAVRQVDLHEAFAFDGEIEGTTRLFEGSLRMKALDRSEARASADLDRRRRHAVGR